MEDINAELVLREQLSIQRTIMANQTTFLSFLRTAMYFLVAGLSIRNLIKLDDHNVIEVIFYVIAGFIFVFGIINYFRQKKIIKKSKEYIGKSGQEFIEKLQD